MRIRIFLALMWVVLVLVPAQADEIIQSVDFTTNDLIFSSSQGFDIVYLKDGDVTNQVGEPQIPVKLLQVALPPGSRVEQVVVIRSESEILPRTYQLFPAQPPQVLSLMNQPIAFIQPKPKAYSLMGEYPGKLVEYSESGFLGGYELVGICVYPVQYIPAQKKIKFYTHIEFKVRYSSNGEIPLPVKMRSETVRAVYENMIQKATLNPKPAALSLKGDKIPSALLSPEDYEYVIITDTTFVTTFQPLADWKTKKGVPAKIVTTGWIYAHYSGYDNAERVRNFIRDAYQNWGTVWVLLGGDTNMVPARIVWAMDSEAGYYPDENDIRCDLYFSDLDGTWDANGNHTYGEVEDSVDLYPDVFVGRAATSSVSKAQALVNKLLNYELYPPTDYQTNMLFFAQILWSNPYTNSGLAKDLIDETYVPSRFDPITKLYEALGNESKATVLAAMNAGQNIINHDGHANSSVMGAGTGYLYISDMDDLYNNPRNSILLSIGCWPAAFDYDCIAEHFVNNPDGGGVAFIGNSRYGWGSPGNPEYGYSDRYDREFFGALFARDFYHIGATV
ncbi:MAG TPA: C25 family cysteine peptidase, partial [candidate division Zixibacteria bacterium]